MGDEIAIHRWFRFSLRTTLIALTISGLLTAWLVSEYRLVEARRAYHVNFEDGPSCIRNVGFDPRTIPQSQEPISWIRWLMGDTPAPTYLMYFPRGDKNGYELRRFRSLFPRAMLWGPPGETNLPEGVNALPPGVGYMI